MHKKATIIVLLLAACYFPLFLHLDSSPIQLFDESRLAVNAIEMAGNGNFLVTHYEGEPDMWNTKPPLMIWLQVLSFQIFGYGELAIRMPSALAALATLLFIGFFCWKIIKRPIWGLCTMGVLITTPGFVANHVSRTGDYDALLILFCVLFIGSFFQFAHSEQKGEKRRMIYLSALFLALAVLTKSIAGLFFVPAAVIYLFLKKLVLETLKSKDTYLAILLFLSIVSCYYFLREHYNPGYLKAVWENELGGRYFEVIENHEKPFYFHLKYLLKTRFVPWIYFLPIGLVVGFYEKGMVRNFLEFLFIGVLTYLLIISFSNTKLMWYDAPLFPLLALITGLGIERINFALNKYMNVNQSLLIILLLLLPYYNIVKSVYFAREQNPKNRQYGLFMKQLTDYKAYSIIKSGYYAHILFYQHSYNLMGYKIDRVEPDQMKAGELALLCEEEPIRILNEGFTYEILKNDLGCMLVNIIERKN